MQRPSQLLSRIDQITIVSPRNTLHGRKERPGLLLNGVLQPDAQGRMEYVVRVCYLYPRNDPPRPILADGSLGRRVVPPFGLPTLEFRIGNHLPNLMYGSYPGPERVEQVTIHDLDEANLSRMTMLRFTHGFDYRTFIRQLDFVIDEGYAPTQETMRNSDLACLRELRQAVVTCCHN